ncbi:MAG: hypothetical protein QOJ76_3181 [Acidobacteriota bacterium]|jgi:hypothetical protein|nr:hypothetical protein [Acidobacteriota bacterium]
MRPALAIVFSLSVLFGIVWSRTAAAGSPSPASGPMETPTPSPEETPTPTPSPTPPDPELERLAREARLADARKTIAQAEKDEATARKEKAEADKAETEARLEAAKSRLGIGAPTPAATPVAGNVSGDVTNFIETQILAETSARAAGMSLFQQLCLVDGNGQTPSPSPLPVPALQKRPLKTLVINSATDKAAIGKYRTILGQLQFLHEHYAKLIKQSLDERDDFKAEIAGAALPLLVPAATSLVKNVADLVNLFRTETEFKNQSVTVNTRLIVSHLTNYLLTRQSSQCKVEAIYQPAVYPLSVSADATSGKLFRAYKQLLDDVIEGDKESNANGEKVVALRKDVATIDANIAELGKKIADYKKQQDEKQKPVKGKKKKGGKQPPPQPAEPFDVQKAEQDIKDDEKEKDKTNGRITRLQQAAAGLQEFKTSLADLFKLLTAVDDATKQPVFVDLISAGRLSDILSEDDTYALDLAVKASGTNRTRRNMFFNAKVAHSAGVSLDANLYDNQDRLVFGRLEDFYIEFTGSEDIRKRKGFKKLNELPR